MKVATDRERIAKAILLSKYHFTVDEIAGQTSIDKNTVKSFIEEFIDFLAVDTTQSPIEYSVKREFVEVLRDQAAYPPRAPSEGGWGISK
jgi:hypothetical protein